MDLFKIEEDYSLDELQMIANLADETHVNWIEKKLPDIYKPGSVRLKIAITRDITVCVLDAIRKLQESGKILKPTEAKCDCCGGPIRMTQCWDCAHE